MVSTDNRLCGHEKTELLQRVRQVSDPSGIRADPMLSVELQCARSECALAQAIYLVNRRITIVARRLSGWAQQAGRR